MGIVAAGAGRLSTIAISSSLLAVFQAKNANALGILPRGDPNRRGGPDHNCFGRGTHILTAHGEVPVENLANGALVMTTNGALPVKWVGRQTILMSPVKHTAHGFPSPRGLIVKFLH